MAESKAVAAVKPQALAPIDELSNALSKMAPEFKHMLPASVSVDKFLRTLKTALRVNSKLVGCDRQSLYSEAMKCAQDGLLPDGREAALVPFGKGDADTAPVAKYMPMPAGICKRARNSGEIVTIDAQEVFEKDTFEAWTDEKGPHFKHTRFRGGDRGKFILVYAYAVTKDGGLYFEEMDATVIDAIEKMALAKAKGKDTPWNGPFKGEMRRKSGLHRLCKYRLPSSSDMEGLLEHDKELYEDAPGDKKEPEEKTAATNKPRRTGEIIDAQVEPDHAGTPEPAAEQAKPEDVSQVPI